ncbi:MAG: tetratricopeptide repeat protein [Limnospira sp. PMC 1279.21]|uniref:tetratricopeptide repeat protein n=1 Tax=Limnospira sp. PMC 1279.21 TaxID=2981062 RepID=UPI0028E0CE93|nr:tetratricopeptide repeat protein [Limnospira sp. PMC 1279.21]MDT9225497.1 tetratricopeptide repeat protein [Limnospira sp. PMC 1279.21]
MSPKFPTGQDAATTLTLWLSGYNKINTLVNRGLAIGTFGTHFTESQFKMMGLNKVVLDVFEIDKNLEQFVASDAHANVLDKYDHRNNSEKSCLINSELESKPTTISLLPSIKKDVLKDHVTTDNSYLIVANRLKRQGKLEEAITTYHQAIYQNPNFAWTYYGLGEALEKLDRLNEALEAYSKAVELNPSSSLLSDKLGVALEKLKKVSDNLSSL